MNANDTELYFSSITDLSCDEKREIWMRRTGHTVSKLAAIAGVVPNTLSRYLREERMPASRYAALVDYGVSPEVLPQPSGRKHHKKRIIWKNWKSMPPNPWENPTLYEKREIWMRRTGHTVSKLAAIAGIVPNVLSRYLRDEKMPAAHHAALVDYGVPPEVLPKPS